VDVALLPSTAAVIVAVPGATPATIPDDDTVAFAGSDVDQARVRDKAFPDRSLAVAESWVLAPGTKVAVSADIVTLSVVGGGGPTTPSPPPQEPMSQARATVPIERDTLFIEADCTNANHCPASTLSPATCYAIII
jgi:hypothetical protein